MSKKILVIEDEKPLARAMELKLTHSGYEIKTAFDGLEGLEMVKADKFDLLILDLIMPKLDGFGFLEELKKLGMKIPTIIISNLSQESDVSRAKEYGVTDYFIKSDSPLSTLAERVNKMIGV
jgi:DNA-binding response OmpR family regulator